MSNKSKLSCSKKKKKKKKKKDPAWHVDIYCSQTIFEGGGIDTHLL